MTWLDDICNVLENPKYPQIKGQLEEIDEEGEIVGKCALGELNCANKVGSDNIVDGDGLIMKSFGVPWEFYHGYSLPRLQTEWRDPTTLTLDCVDIDKEEANIQNWIYGLNDLGFTYSEIIDFLRTTFGDAV